MAALVQATAGQALRPVAAARPAPQARLAAAAPPSTRLMRLVVRAAESATEAVEQTFLEELRDYSMKLHTKQQAPKEGKAEQPKAQKPFAPTAKGFLAFMVESKVVYDTFEDIVQKGEAPFYKQLRNTGLERGQALEADIEQMRQKWELEVPVATEDGVGHQYAKILRDLSATNPPAFMCIYYNHYFAHTAGGRMIGKAVSNAVLDGWSGAFYQWEGDVKTHLEGVRSVINEVASQWTREEKDACIAETPHTFCWGGRLVQLITEGTAMGH